MTDLPTRVSDFNALEGLEKPLFLAVGIFDGVHKGHQSVIQEAVKAAESVDGVSAVLTFDPHPSRLFRPEAATELLLPISEKVSLLQDAGIQVVISKQFDAEFSAIPAENFIAHLKEELPTLAGIFVGSNFRFGKSRLGDVDLLKTTGASEGILVHSADRLQFEGLAISSTRIREDLKSGAIERVNTMLGYRYRFHGTVVAGQKLGRQLGFPTLNLAWNPECQPRFGVYLVCLKAKGEAAGSFGIANYGVKPTVCENSEPLLEVHLLNPTELDCGSQVEVEWIQFARGEMKFESLEALKAQIACDLKWARGVVANGDSYNTV
mgnify:CR=1 FL=1